MFEPLLTAVWLVAVVLLVSGVAKLISPAQVESAFAQLRVATWLNVAPIRRAMPFLEVLLGAVLLLAPAPVSWVAAGAAIALMLAYTTLIGRALGFDDDVECACFGSLGATKVTWRSLTRNILLTLAAAATLVLTLQTDSSALGAVLASSTAWAWLLGAALVGAVAWLVAPQGDASPQSQQLPTDEDEPLDYVRAPIPNVVVRQEDGSQASLTALARFQARLLIFSRPGCPACNGLKEKAPGFQEQLGPVVALSLISRTPGVGLEDLDGEAAKQLGIKSLPAAVLLGADGLLAGGPVEGRAEVESFVGDVAAALSD